jgi:hypothetical protein
VLIDTIRDYNILVQITGMVTDWNRFESHNDKLIF